jgi:hypothetical protein
VILLKEIIKNKENNYTTKMKYGSNEKPKK